MSSKILELLRKIDEASSRQECFSVQRLTDDLRVLLAAPVVERQPLGWIDPFTIRAIACNPQSCDRFPFTANEDRANGYTMPVYTALPELAELQAELAKQGDDYCKRVDEIIELQATIARLTTENERLNNQLCVCPACHGQGEVFAGSHSYQGHFQPPEPDMDKCGECDGDGVIGTVIDLAAALAEIERLKGGQGEPVAWSYCPECGCEEMHHEEGEHKQCANCHQEWFSDIDYSEVVRGNLEKLKASQPAPVSVPDGWKLVPIKPTMEMLEALMEWNKVGNINAYNNILEAAPYCLDKVKELNQ